jgi:hypothetical protein
MLNQETREGLSQLRQAADYMMRRKAIFAPLAVLMMLAEDIQEDVKVMARRRRLL